MFSFPANGFVLQLQQLPQITSAVSSSPSSVWRHLLILTMSISLGGLGFMSLRNPFSELLSVFLGKGDLRSMFCLIVFSIVSLVLGSFLFHVFSVEFP